MLTSIPTTASIEALEHRLFLSAVPLKDGLTGYLSAGSVTLNGYTYFSGRDPAHGQELWRTNGTSAGTTLVKDIYTAAGTFGSRPQQFMVFNNAVLFTAMSDGDDWGLWRTDGTAPGTYRLAEVPSPFVGTGMEGWYVFRGKLVGMSIDGPIATDGTLAGTRLIADSPGSSLVATTQRIYWLSEDQQQVFSYNGTTSETVAATKGDAINVQLQSSFGSGIQFSYTWLNNNKPTDELVQIAPREQVIRPLQEKFCNYDDNDEVEFRGAKFYTDGQDRLWKRGASPAQDVLIHTITRGSLTVCGDSMYFTDGARLFKNDGTPSGTVVVREFTSASTGPRDLIGVGTRLYFLQEMSPNNLQPWWSDGTAGSTILASKIGPQAPPYSAVFGLGRHGANVLVGVQDQLYLLTPAASRPYLGSGGMIRITGTSERDIIRTTRAGDSIDVNINGASYPFAFNDVAKICVYAGDGNDRVESTVDLPTSVMGGDGNDLIKTAAASDILYGGAGDDSLYGGGGRDWLFGEAGNDRLAGGGDRDILWGGAGRDTVLMSLDIERRDFDSQEDLLS